MNIKLRQGEFKNGYYGLVAFQEEYAVKIFKKREEEENHIENVFHSETEAYEIATQNERSAILIPKYYGKKTIKCITSASGIEITQDYYCKLAYKMSFEEGLFIKINNTQVPDEERKRVTDIFHSIGISYLNDSSVIIKNNQITCIIDFAIRRHEPEW